MRSSVALLIVSACVANTAVEACTLGSYAPTATHIQFGRIELSGFPAGSFRLADVKLLGDGEEWPFSLMPVGGSVHLAITGKSGRRLEGELTLTKPITGTVREAADCSRVLEIATGSLDDVRFKISVGNLGNAFGGRVVAAGVTGTIVSQRALRDTAGATSGALSITVPAAEIQGGMFEFAPGLSVTALAQSKTAVTLDANLAFLDVAIRDGTFVTPPVRIGDGAVRSISLAGMQANATSVRAAAVAISFKSAVATMEFSTVGIVATRVEHAVNPTVVAEATKSLSVGTLSGPARVNADRRLEINPDGVLVQNATVTGNLSIALSQVKQVVSGPGSVKLRSLSPGSIDATADIQSPKFEGAAVADVLFKPTTLSIAANGPKNSLNVTGKGTAAELALANLRILKAKLAYVFKSSKDQEASIGISSSNGTVELGGVDSQRLMGALSKLNVSGRLRPNQLDQLNLEIAPGGIAANANLTQKALPLLGGTLNIEDSSVSLRNTDQLIFGEGVETALIDLGRSKLSLTGLKLEPSDQATPLDAQTVSKEILPTLFQVDIAAKAASFLHVAAHFDLPGFKLKVPPPISSVTFDVGNMSVEVSEFEIEKFTFDLTEEAASVAIVGTKLVAGTFKTKKAAAGEPQTYPVISGSAATPLVINRAVAIVPLRVQPLRMAEFGIIGLSFAAAPVAYSMADMDAEAQRATIAIDELSIPQNRGAIGNVAGMIALENSTVRWSGAADGKAFVETLRLNLSGDPKEPDGSLRLEASRVSLNGRADIPLSTKPDGSHGCSMSVPASVDMTVRSIEGDLTMTKGKLHGTVEASDADTGYIKYVGHRDCGWEQLVKTGTLVKVPYPCGTWRKPFKICQHTVAPVFTIGMTFVVKAIDLQIKPDSVRFKLEEDGSFGACRITLDTIVPVVPPLYSISPQIPVGGEIAKILNDSIAFGIGALQSTLTAGLLNLYSEMTLLGFGRSNPVKSNC